MCLLVVAFRVIPSTPLLIGANRDEFLTRPAVPATVLRPGGPRILGGRDLQSGGTWLALNELGVFAGLTNQPLGDARDPTRRTRGELPLLLASHPSARLAVGDLLETRRPEDYNGSWLLVGDRDALYYVDFTGLVEPEAVGLPPGLYVLENRPLGAPSPKADHVARSLGSPPDVETALSRLLGVLADHSVPAPAAGGDGPMSSSNCVHLDGYGTRSSCVIRIGDLQVERPRIRVSDGPPCRAPLVDVSGLWLGTGP
ncbi:MAG: NRDE family protein [Acidimicrobiales bacterium]